MPSPNPSDPSYPSQVPRYQNPYQGEAHAGTHTKEARMPGPVPAERREPQMPTSPSYQSSAYRSPQAPAYPAPGASQPTGR